MSFFDDLEKINNKDSLAHFISELRNDLKNNPDEWENPNLDMFLEAMQGWVQDSDGCFKNFDLLPPPPSAWKFVAMVLHAAKVYE
jgi:hypothetical protein